MKVTEELAARLVAVRTSAYALPLLIGDNLSGLAIEVLFAAAADLRNAANAVEWELAAIHRRSMLRHIAGGHGDD